jgi:chloramphenicol-sensitive protein RarD
VRRWGEVRRCFARPMIWTLLATTILIAINWYVFIVSVEQKQVVQTSLGYFITPLVNVSLGLIVFQERLRRLQWLALSLAAAGVVSFAVAHGETPWYSLTIAASFGLYGLLRKTLAVDGLVGLSVETLLLFPLSAGYLVYLGDESALGRYDWSLDVLLVLSGVVTAVPLMCFAQAVRRLPLTTVGFLQYLSPSLSFLLATQVFKEDFEDVKWISFACIWTALAIFSADAVRAYRKR